VSKKDIILITCDPFRKFGSAEVPICGFENSQRLVARAVLQTFFPSPHNHDWRATLGTIVISHETIKKPLDVALDRLGKNVDLIPWQEKEETIFRARSKVPLRQAFRVEKNQVTTTGTGELAVLKSKATITNF
jgi:hypothetical protein